jgi:2-polyprenyl-3-methyl-5-hydroxy-6-metoxy-1,4-benzoquinol methylase
LTAPTENAAKNTHQTVEQILLDADFSTDLSARKVLDVPCGEGAFTARLMKHGMPVVPGDVVDIFKVPENSDLTLFDMDQPFPFEDEYFTDIVCIDGIEHIERQFNFVRECNRTLKMNGTFIVSTPNISSARSRWRYFLTGHHNYCKNPLNEENISPLQHRNMISLPELRYQLHTNGFRIESVVTNRVKPISWVYAWLYPISYVVSRAVYIREEKDTGQQERNREITRTMFSPAVFFGDLLIVTAKKIADAP